MDKPVYIDTYFRIESGYEWGYGMSKEKTEAFFAEIKSLFSQNGFTIEERKNGCPDVVMDKTRLYCHPQDLSGPVRKELIERIEKILAQGTTFQYLRTDTYGEILDLTEEEELAYYHETHDMTIEGVFRDAFRTKRRTCTRTGRNCWNYLSKSCASKHSVGIPLIRIPLRYGVMSGRFTIRW